MQVSHVLSYKFYVGIPYLSSLGIKDKQNYLSFLEMRAQSGCF